MREAYKLAYSAWRYELIADWSHGDDYFHRTHAGFVYRTNTESELLRLPPVAVGAAYQSWQCSDDPLLKYDRRDGGYFAEKLRYKKHHEHNTWIDVPRKKANAVGLGSVRDMVTVRLSTARELGLVK